ncbi:hypothetical protein [Streptomyces sp. NPDC018693]|uniref:hypothetical protein n=1 Tax=unclassified Streptomyces TaxID=2593676 RepID=UPI00378E9BF2
MRPGGIEACPSDRLDALVAAARPLLAEDLDLGMMNSVPEGYGGPWPLPEELPAVYADFLARADGGIFGAVVLFGAKYAPRSQFYADSVEGGPVRLGREEWFCAGKIDEHPFFLHRATGEVWGFPDIGTIWWQSERFDRLGGDLTGFLLDKVFGPAYLALSGEGPDEPWPTVLRRLGRIDGLVEGRTDGRMDAHPDAHPDGHPDGHLDGRN